MRVVDFKDEVAVTKRRLADLPDRVVEGDPHHETRMRYTSPDGTLLAGTWTSTPGKWIAFADRDEFCVLLSGHIKLISDDGTEQEFRKGDSFLIPNGFRGYWHVLETTTKHFVIRDYSAD
ncbi:MULTISPECIES: cupin domain-containing protein [unclassified Meridianimarinicoccus]|uniref:cupin domain-containing protein n=1 Tax=unclassified Meridianimarinicoccus TaxID=2923344 RepID=UPI0018688030|nr:cupin domain-containing protein [Fluviibacterium sp. MJW13]